MDLADREPGDALCDALSQASQPNTIATTNSHAAAQASA